MLPLSNSPRLGSRKQRRRLSGPKITQQKNPKIDARRVRELWRYQNKDLPQSSDHVADAPELQ
eukprot:788836-Prorocentrum_minimum.AAC.1